MPSIPDALDKFNHLTDALVEQLQRFLEAIVSLLPDARYRQSFLQLVPAMLAARSPRPATAAAHAPNVATTPWALAKRFYSLLHTPRSSHHVWLGALYDEAAQQVVALPPGQRVLVALDPMNLEKAYARKVEGICRVHKKTPPGSAPKKAGRKQKGRITWGYPTISAVALNTPQPALLYQRLFSYVTDDFVSQPWEWMETMAHLHQLLPRRKICIVADAEADDQKLWREAQQQGLEIIVRATKKRNIEVWNHRRRRWEPAALQPLAKSLPGRCRFHKVFTHAGRTVPIEVALDWFRFRLPDGSWTGWAVVAQTRVMGQERPEDMWLPPLHVVLVTNRPVRRKRDAWKAYRDWSQRGQIELLYRFVQEDGLDAESILLHDLEAFRRMLLLVWLAAFFVLRLEKWWCPVLIQWIRSLASSVVGMAMDRGGHYLLLRGLQRVLDGHALLERIRIRPPPTRYLPPRG
jgi:hypothetical protein